MILAMPPFAYRLLPWPILIVAVFALQGCHSQSTRSKLSGTVRPAPAGDAQATAKGGTNGLALAKAAQALSPAQQAGLQFLLENMPEHDRRDLPPSLLIENVSLAYEAFAQAPWREQIPEAIFLNDILPYACVNEKRDAWRKELRAVCAPLVADCRTPAEAAQRLNQKLFKLVKVRYSTERQKADQSPLESMESGLATCTGLSILLVDACRSVGVPARLVATPMWTNLRGNHTWVEIWDGQWHFTGAAEPDPKGLNRGWFRHDASQARRDEPRHAIYASSFKKTGLAFPLVWARRVNWVSAVNVTDHYTAKAKPADTGRTRLLVKVLDRPGGRRVATQVTITESTNATVKFEGTTKDESADGNDFLTFEIARDRAYDIQAGPRKKASFRAGTNAQEVVVLHLNETPAFTIPAQPRYVPAPITRQLKTEDEAKLRQALAAFFVAPTDQQAAWRFPRRLERLLQENEPAVRRIAWEAFRAAPIHDRLKEDYDAHQVRFEKHLSPYTVKTVGARPTNGWALFIAMHGGGGAPKQVNDSQWKHMQIYYRDHPEAGGYLYVALRAPNDSWNGFYDTYVYPLIANLTRQFRLYGDVDPNKVFIMGYSHGGYGAFAIGPKIPDHFAAIHASAAAPTDGETTAKTLRNTVFTAMVGEKDTMYGRHDRNKKFAETIEKLRGGRTDIYPVRVDIIAGNGHGGLPDRDNIAGMYPAVRNPVPRELTWLMTDKVVKDFFWLRTDTPGKQREINAGCRDNRLVVSTTTNVTAASVLLDSRLVDFSKRVTLELNGETSRHQLQPSLRVLCASLQRRGDPDLAFTAELPLPLTKD
jgi:predicted esterase